jgi:hypothetical protein
VLISGANPGNIRSGADNITGAACRGSDCHPSGERDIKVGGAIDILMSIGDAEPADTDIFAGTIITARR